MFSGDVQHGAPKMAWSSWLGPGAVCVSMRCAGFSGLQGRALAPWLG